MQVTVHYEELADALGKVGFTDQASGYHGTLCGALCVRAPEQIDLLRLVPTDSDEPLSGDAAAQAALRRACTEALGALQDEEMTFAPLLPDDESDLAPRVQALAAWCEGFLFGLASKPGLDLKKVSEDAREIIRDFTQFTQASLADDGDLDMEETAYIELVEYIRVGAQLLFMEFRPVPVPDPQGSTQLH